MLASPARSLVGRGCPRPVEPDGPQSYAFISTRDESDSRNSDRRFGRRSDRCGLRRLEVQTVDDDPSRDSLRDDHLFRGERGYRYQAHR